MHLRLAKSASPLIMVLLGIPFALQRGRQASFSLGFHFKPGDLHGIFPAAGNLYGFRKRCDFTPLDCGVGRQYPAGPGWFLAVSPNAELIGVRAAAHATEQVYKIIYFANNCYYSDRLQARLC